MNTATTPTTRDLNQLATDLVHQQSTMTLATACDKAAWATPVYYVFYKGAFFFFSNPQSRHIKEASVNDAVAAAIHPTTDTWQGIQGIQMSGRIQVLGPAIAHIKSFRAYIRKFPFTREFFEPGQALDLATFIEHFKVKFYRLEPDTVLYLDNRIRFGFRTQVELG